MSLSNKHLIPSFFFIKYANLKEIFWSVRYSRFKHFARTKSNQYIITVTFLEKAQFIEKP